MRVLDSHIHLWDPRILRYEWLSGRLARPFLPEDLAVAFEGDQDRDFIFVQAECVPEDAEAEVAWVSSIAAEAGVVGIVARVALEHPSSARVALDRVAGRGLVVGVRRLLQEEPEELLRSTGLLMGCRELAARDLTFDACVRSTQLNALATLADAAPGLRIVVDHLGKPRVGSIRDPARPTREWVAGISELARRPSVFCKISGLPAEATGPWTSDLLEPFLDVALEAFGPQRLLYGSDWPVSEPARRWEHTVRQWATDRLGEREIEGLMSTNARQVYFARQP